MMKIKRTKKAMALCVILLILNLTFIWGNSLMPGSASAAFSDWAKQIIELVCGRSDNPSAGGTGLLRKLAHFTEFTSLGLVLTWLFAMLRKKPWIPFLCGFLAACTDEGIQCFVPDRGPGLRDVMIDTSGVLMGVLLFLLGLNQYQKKKNKLLEDVEQ